MGKDTILSVDVSAGELIAGTEHYTMYYYRLKDNRLWVLGHENPTNLLQYTTPLLSAIYPLAYGESHHEDYASKGTYSSNQTFSMGGTVAIRADAKGMMILPSGETGTARQNPTNHSRKRQIANANRFGAGQTHEKKIVPPSSISNIVFHQSTFVEIYVNLCHGNDI